jgi:hypothetical protein
VTQKRGDFIGAEFARMSPAMKHDEPPDPLQVGLLRADAVMADTYELPDLIQ